jgi:hypothetical protein
VLDEKLAGIGDGIGDPNRAGWARVMAARPKQEAEKE